MRNNLVSIFCEKAKTNKDLVFITADLGYNVLNKIFEQFPDQYINVGICEQNMTSIAAGLALSGKCVFTYSIGSFSTLRCIEQIRNDVCYHNANVKIVALAAGFAYGVLGMSHHATEDIACMRSLPNITVFSPCDPFETREVTKAAIKMNTPCYIRLGRGGEQNLWDNFGSFEIGKAYQMSKGNTIVIFSTGSITKEAKSAVSELAKENIFVSLYSFPTIKPIDANLIKACAKDYKIIITLEEHQRCGGFGSAVSEVLSEIPSHAKLIRMGLDNTFASVVGDTDYLRSFYGLDAKSIIKIIKGNI